MGGMADIGSMLTNALGTLQSGAANIGSSGMGGLQALWQQIQKLRGGAGPMADPSQANPMMNPAGSPMGLPGMAGGGFSLAGDQPSTGQFGTNVADAANPANFSLTGPNMGGGAPTTDFGANVNPAMAPATAQAGTPSLPLKPPTDAMARAMKLQQYAAALNGLKNMQQAPKPEDISHSFRMSGGGGSGMSSKGGLGPPGIGPARPPSGPVTSAGMFLLSPAGKSAMARLQTLTQGDQLAA